MVAFALGLPAAGQAQDPLSNVTSECSQVIAKGGTASCTSLQYIDDGRYISAINTSANFHDAGARGWLTIDWYDAENKLVASYGCMGVGLPGNGLADVSRGNCTQYGGARATYAPGMSTIVVTAWNEWCPADSCTFHGKVRLSAIDAVL